MGIRSWASARTPQREQPTTLAVDSTVTNEFVGPLGHVEHPEPIQSQKRLGQPDTVIHVRGLPSPLPSTATKMAGLLTPWWMVGYVTVPSSTRRARLLRMLDEPRDSLRTRHEVAGRFAGGLRNAVGEIVGIVERWREQRRDAAWWRDNAGLPDRAAGS